MSTNSLLETGATSESSRIRTHNHLIHKQTLKHLTFNHLTSRRVGLNGRVFIYELSGCRFESRCCYVNFRAPVSSKEFLAVDKDYALNYQPYSVLLQEIVDQNNSKYEHFSPSGSLRRNGLGISTSSFCRITKKDLHQHPFEMNIRHQRYDDMLKWSARTIFLFLTEMLMNKQAYLDLLNKQVLPVMTQILN